jgi:hypothetical protein
VGKSVASSGIALNLPFAVNIYTIICGMLKSAPKEPSVEGLPDEYLLTYLKYYIENKGRNVDNKSRNTDNKGPLNCGFTQNTLFQ